MTLHIELYQYGLTSSLLRSPLHGSSHNIGTDQNMYLHREMKQHLMDFEVFFYCLRVTPSLNDVFKIKNELKKLHIEPFLHMPRYYKNAKKQIISWKKIIYTIKFCVLLPLVGKSAS